MISELWERNSEALEIVSRYLTHYPQFITKEAAEEISKSCEVSKEYAFFVLLCAVCGIVEGRSKKEQILAREYLLRGIHKLEVSTYQNNPYYKAIRIPERKLGNWEFRMESYAPYEGFVCRDLKVTDSYQEIPQIGFFEEAFSFPAVLEEDNEWMTITPSEIETMQPALDLVEGKIVTFGLGLGYFAFMASRKAEVTSVTVVERNPEVIQLFEEVLLPQFEYKQKIRIIKEDAFSYVMNMEPENYDFAFVDLWRNVSDGLPLYIKMKKREKTCPGTTFLYWVEESLLSNLRWKVMQIAAEQDGEPDVKAFLLKQGVHSEQEIERYFDKEALRDMAKNL